MIRGFVDFGKTQRKPINITVVMASMNENVLISSSELRPSKGDFPVKTLPKFRLLPESADEARAFTPDSAQGVGGPSGELPEIASAQVRQLLLFPVTPEVLYRVKSGA
jgi:hypothetical protein